MSMIGFGWQAEKFSKSTNKIFDTFKSKYKNKLTKNKTKAVNNLSRPIKLASRYQRTKYKHFRDTLFYKIIVAVILLTIISVAYALASM